MGGAVNIYRYRMSKLLAFFLAIMTAQTSIAQDMCKDILSSGIANQTVSQNSRVNQTAAKAFYCSSNYQEAKRQYDRSFSNSQSGGIDTDIIGIFKGGGQGATNESEKSKEENFNLWKQSNCQSQSSSAYGSEFSYLAQSLVDHEVVRAWSTCMSKREGLSCWATPSGNALNVAINWRANSSMPAMVQSSTVENGISKFGPQLGSSLVPQSFVLDPGELIIPISRSGRNFVNVVLNINHAGSNYSCNVYVPSLPEEPVMHLRYEGTAGCSATSDDYACKTVEFWGPSKGNRICKAEIVHQNLSSNLREGESGFIDLKTTRDAARIYIAAARRAISTSSVDGPLSINAKYRVFEILDVDLSGTKASSVCTTKYEAAKPVFIDLLNFAETEQNTDLLWLKVQLTPDGKIFFGKMISPDIVNGKIVDRYQSTIVRDLDQNITILKSLNIEEEVVNRYKVNGYLIQ